MKKNYFLKAIFVFFLITGWTVCSYAGAWVPATNLDTTWIISSSGDKGSVIAKDTTINLAAHGTGDGGFYGALYKTETAGIAGIGATLQVDQVSGNCNLGLRASIGQIGNKQIEVILSMTQYDQQNMIVGNKFIQYDIRMSDMNTKENNLVASGIFGSWNGTWVPGKPLFLGFARIGSELWLYADGFKQLHKIQMLDGIEPYYGDVAGYVSASQGAVVSITGSISDIFLYYP